MNDTNTTTTKRIPLTSPSSTSQRSALAFPPLSSPSLSAFPSPPTSPIAKAKRRQSSIAYFTPSSPSPWEKEGQLSRLDISRVGGSTLTENGHRTAQESEKDGEEGESGVNLTSSPRSSHLSVAVGSRVTDKDPLTLVERHVDLLHFIAQKERKCLELRDQLAVHEKELADLKRKWERIVNRGFSHSEQFDPTSSSSTTSGNSAGLGSTALEGLKEGVRIIATGWSDLGGGQDTIQSQQERRLSSQKALSHAQRGSDSSASLSNGTTSGRISNNSVSSIREDDYATGQMNIVDEANTTVILSSSRTGSLNVNMHKRSSRPHSRGPSATPSAFVSPAESSVSSPSSLTASLLGSAKHGPPISALPPPSVMPGLGSLTMGVPNVGTPVSSWVGSVGKKLGELQKGETFTMNQKRASVLLADVSQSIASVLSTGPLATNPTSPTPSSRPRPTSTTNRSERTPLSSKTNRNEAAGSWLDEDEETIHAGEIMVPDSKSPHTGGIECKTEETKAMSSFDDDDWNW